MSCTLRSVRPARRFEFCKMVAKRDVDSLDSIEAVSRSRRSLLPYGAAVLAEVIKIMEPVGNRPVRARRAGGPASTTCWSRPSRHRIR